MRFSKDLVVLQCKSHHGPFRSSASVGKVSPACESTANWLIDGRRSCHREGEHGTCAACAGHRRSLILSTSFKSLALQVTTCHAPIEVEFKCEEVFSLRSSFPAVGSRPHLRQAVNIFNNYSHPDHSLFSILPSGRRYKILIARTARFRNSFYSTVIRIEN